MCIRKIKTVFLYSNYRLNKLLFILIYLLRHPDFFKYLLTYLRQYLQYYSTIVLFRLKEGFLIFFSDSSELFVLSLLKVQNISNSLNLIFELVQMNSLIVKIASLGYSNNKQNELLEIALDHYPLLSSLFAVTPLN